MCNFQLNPPSADLCRQILF